MNNEQIIDRLEAMTDERLEEVVELFPNLSMLAQLILEERRKRSQEP